MKRRKFIPLLGAACVAPAATLTVSKQVAQFDVAVHWRTLGSHFFVVTDLRNGQVKAFETERFPSAPGEPDRRVLNAKRVVVYSIKRRVLAIEGVPAPNCSRCGGNIYYPPQNKERYILCDNKPCRDYLMKISEVTNWKIISDDPEVRSWNY